MVLRRSLRPRDDHAARPSCSHPKRGAIALLPLACIALSLMGLASCASWGVRPESAVIFAPPDEVWNGALELLREGEFKVEQQDNNARELRATKDIIIRMISDRSTPTTAQKVRHQVDLSVRPSGEGRSVIDLIYRVEKVVEENEAFRFLQNLRDRVAMSEGVATPPSPRR